MRYFITDEGEYSFTVHGNPPCYDGMAQLAAASKLRQHPKVQDPEWIEDYLSWPAACALLMQDGHKLAGFMLLKRVGPGPKSRCIKVDAAFAQGSPNEELAYAHLSCGLYHWLQRPNLRFASLGYSLGSVKRLDKAIIKVLDQTDPENHDRLERFGWRSCGREFHAGLWWRQFHLCSAYGLSIDQVLARARQFSLSRS